MQSCRLSVCFLVFWSNTHNREHVILFYLYIYYYCSASKCSPLFILCNDEMLTIRTETFFLSIEDQFLFFFPLSILRWSKWSGRIDKSHCNAKPFEDILLGDKKETIHRREQKKKKTFSLQKLHICHDKIIFCKGSKLIKPYWILISSQECVFIYRILRCSGLHILRSYAHTSKHYVSIKCIHDVLSSNKHSSPIHRKSTHPWNPSTTFRN